MANEYSVVTNSNRNEGLNSHVPQVRSRAIGKDLEEKESKRFKTESTLDEQSYNGSSEESAASKIRKRREKLEMWKKMKKIKAEACSIKLDSGKKHDDPIDSSPTADDKVRSRRLKIAEFMRNKSILDSSKAPDSPSQINDSQKISAFKPTEPQNNHNQIEKPKLTENVTAFPNSTLVSKLSSSLENPIPNQAQALQKAKPAILKFPSNPKKGNKIAGFKFGLQITKPNPLAKPKSLSDFHSGATKTNLSSLPEFKPSTDNSSPTSLKALGAQPESFGIQSISNQEEIDPLDAYMQDIESSQAENPGDTSNLSAKLANQDKLDLELREHSSTYDSRASLNRTFNDKEDGIPDDPENILELAAKRLKKKDFITVDHTKVAYEPFVKSFYTEPSEISSMSQEEVDALRYQLDDIKIRGQNPPNPVTKWTFFGLPVASVQVIKKLGFESPTPIQSQSIPAILQGRDLIGVAKTGSGKTLAFVLPMLRHIKAQTPLKPMEGPIAMIMTPTRELAVQIAKECRLFSKSLNLRTVCSYGGSPIKDQIAELKRGAEIVVCTPGRMIDLLSANSGRVTNLKRVTFLVLDEADRMFDMGFEPQVMKIIQNVRPSRQTLLFSATFPRQMEALARKVLKRPLEITVGGRSAVGSDITQIVQVVDFDEKFFRLLEILGSSLNDNPETCALIFVERQEAADTLFKDLLRRGYMCNSLHGGKDQSDRDQTILDFKQGVFNFLIATSVAARGLDVKRLNLVVNYDCPNHLEDYVHRVGRTGRAGNKGTAITFVSKDQGRYAIEIIKALQSSGVDVPRPLQDLADSFLESVRTGEVKYYNANASGGFGGKGLEKLDQERQAFKNIQRLTFGVEDEPDDEDEFDDLDELSKSKEAAQQGEEIPSKNKGSTTNTALPGELPNNITNQTVKDAIKAAQKAAEKISMGSAPAKAGNSAVVSAVDEINAKFGLTPGSQAVTSNNDIHSAEFFAEIEINDYPQKARWKVTNRETLSQITESTGTAITVRGVFYQPGKTNYNSSGSNNLITASAEQSSFLSKIASSSSNTNSNSNSNSNTSISTGNNSNLNANSGSAERKLHLRIEGNSEIGLERAKAEIKRILTEATMQSIEHESRQGTSGGQQYSRYSVL